jgi:putative alpha-1,2-mannosidase
MPFGAMRIGPDTTNNTLDLGYRHCSGYNWADGNIRAFSHTRLVNAGVTDLGNIGVMPTSRRGVNEAIKAAVTGQGELWLSHYVKKSEYAKPGRYSVYMDSIDVQADILTFDKFAGVHRYTWNPTEKYGSKTETTKTENIIANQARGMVIDICHAADKHLESEGACLFADLSIQPDKRSFKASVLFRGSLSGRGSDDGVSVYVYGAFVDPMESKTLFLLEDWLVCTGDKACDVVSGVPAFYKDAEPTVFSSTSGKLLAHVRFPNMGSGESTTIELVVGLSFISADQAKSNLAAALSKNSALHPLSPPSQSSVVSNGVSYFAKLQLQVTNEWCTALSTLQIQDSFPPDSMDGLTLPEKPVLPDIPFDKFKRDFLTIAYSSHYRTLLSPTQYTEASSEYLGMDRALHNAKTERAAAGMVSLFGEASLEYYSDLSLWDTFRTQHPWLLLSRPDVAIGVMRSMGEMSKHAGR